MQINSGSLACNVKESEIKRGYIIWVTGLVNVRVDGK